MKIDVVYTWVDGKDENWVKKKEKYKADYLAKSGANLSSHAVSANRAAASEIELYYSIKSVKKNMPWVNRIFVVTDKQIPTKVVGCFPDVILISHAEIFPSTASLPNFNSRAIELALVNIPDISEYFIYMNDDFFINAEVSLKNFYFKNKISVFVEKSFGPLKCTPEFYLKIGRQLTPPNYARAYTNQLLTKTYGDYERGWLQHVPIFFIKSKYLECQRLFPQEVMQTYKNRFRNNRDFVAVHFYPYYMLHENMGILNTQQPGAYIPVTQYKWLNYFVYKKIKPQHLFFCLNDERTTFTKSTTSQMEKFLSKKFEE